jgi:hypothetical protein
MSRIRRRGSTITLLTLVVPLLTGCATAAQRQAQQAALGTQEGVTQFKACVAVVLAKPEYASLLPHTLDPDTGQATMAQLTDERLPSQNDARLLASRFDEATLCRTRYLSALSSARPDLVPIVATSYATNATNVASLVERKITWAEAVRRGQVLSADTRQKIVAANQEWAANLNASHEAEMARRQAASNAMLQWSAQQQMINAVNRPRQTNCTGFGNSVNCTSD